MAPRRGAAIIELAVCVPLIVSVSLLAVDFSNKMHDQETLQIAAYEAARVISRPGYSRQKGIDRATKLLSDRGITNVNIDILPADFAALKPGDTLEVVISFKEGASKSPADLLLKAPLGVRAKYIRQ
jgi:hypothetical protein